MRVGSRIAGLRFRPPLSSSPRLVRTESRSIFSPEDSLLLRKGDLEVLPWLQQKAGQKISSVLYEDSLLLRKGDLEFLPWLQQKTGQEISSVLSLGSSVYGRSLFASRFIHAGQCILKIPYSIHITRGNVPSELECLVGINVGDIAWLAVALLKEMRRGQDSEWAPYICSLPHVDNMHCLMFWSNDELEMVQPSLVYQEALHQRICIEREFLAIKPALQHFSDMFGDISLTDFLHAFALVGSRAWETSKGLSLIPFADFLNHDGNSESVLLNDEDKEISEIIADRDYAAGEQVLIRYGKFPTGTLLLDFGFTLANNMHEQVQISMDVPLHDPLHTLKMELLHKHRMLTVANIGTLSSTKCSFTLKEVRTIRGKGIPQSLRAFVRVLSAKSLEELKEMCNEASKNDGRLARRPLRSRSREIEAHCILLSRIQSIIQEYNASIEFLESQNTLSNGIQQPCRRQMARDLLTGELRVLKSACSWLTKYCSK